MAATVYSTQITEQNAAAHTPSDTTESRGRKRYAYGAYETAETTGLVDGTTVAMCRLPGFSRLLSVRVTSESMGSSSEAVDIGVEGTDGSGYYDAANSLADDIDLISADLDMATENVKEEAIVTRAAVGLTFDKEVYITGTAETDDWAAEKDFILEVEYVVD